MNGISIFIAYDSLTEGPVHRYWVLARSLSSLAEVVTISISSATLTHQVSWISHGLSSLDAADVVVSYSPLYDSRAARIALSPTVQRRRVFNGIVSQITRGKRSVPRYSSAKRIRFNNHLNNLLMHCFPICALLLPATILETLLLETKAPGNSCETETYHALDTVTVCPLPLILSVWPHLIYGEPPESWRYPYSQSRDASSSTRLYPGSLSHISD